MDSDLPSINPTPPVYGGPPPVMNRPPPVISPPVPPGRRKKGNGWRTFAIILLVLFVLSALVNLGHMGRSLRHGRGGSEAGPRLEESVLRDNNASDKIAVIPIQGVISGGDASDGGLNMVTVVKEQLKLAKKDSDVKAVILKVDSPGGEVLASDEIASAIRKFQNDSGGKPVIVSMGNLAASGGYYVSVPCQWIVANELTITGSIGVIMDGINYRGLMDKIGVQPQVFKSGKLKDMLSPMKETNEITPEEIQIVQNFIGEAYGKFKGVVQSGREAAFKANTSQRSEEKVSHQLSADWANYADGRILSGTQARELGLVDELGDFDVAVNRAEKIAGIKDANIVQYQPVMDLASLLHLFGQTDAKTVKIDWGVELPRLRPGCAYYLLSPYAR